MNTAIGSIRGFSDLLNPCKQYVAEFLDNSLDAIESFQWNELKEDDSQFKFTLDRELSLENLSLLTGVKEEGKSEPLNEDAKHTLMQEIGIESVEKDENNVVEEDVDLSIDQGQITKEEIEVEEEVMNIITDMQSLTKPVEPIIDVEPIVIIRLRESEPASFLTSEISQKNVMYYTFEILDNGTGMSKVDLKKFGKYLASSKSMQLKQTRGSQGFGAPSAFSDAQNTTGRPVVAVSSTVDNVYATVSEFFTTSKNEKKYLIHPTDVDSPFLHGSYIKLNYLNIKYVRGYVDTYIQETALMNPHVTIVFIDPYNEEHIYPRKVSSFPRAPKYALPHPSSTNIGDLQDLLSKSENLTLSAFLQENFVRISNNVAKEIIDLAERDLQDKLNLLILRNGFLTLLENKKDEIYFVKNEKRVYGRSKKPRDKLIIYEVKTDELKNRYHELVDEYYHFIKEHEKINDKIKKNNTRIEKADTKKEQKKIERENRKLLKDIDGIRKEKDEIRSKLNKLFENSDEGLEEVKRMKNREDLEELVEEVQISKTRPSELTNDQFNSLFLAFKSVKYMSPPTDTVVPVGESVLENTLIKELGLKISENLDDFDTPVDNIRQADEILKRVKRKELMRLQPNSKKKDLAEIPVHQEEIIELNSKILSNFLPKVDQSPPQELVSFTSELIKVPDNLTTRNYSALFEFFLQNYTRDDDFVGAETRDPTSGKGLAYVVEAVLAYSKRIEVPKRSRDVLSRFVNRTPKLRDSADCAITKAVQSVNWKNYKLETYDNNLPKGPIKLLVNVSGPFVHLMFKSQSKNALADNEELIKEIKYCLEAIGRRLRVYLNRRINLRKKEKRANLIEKYIPKFVSSLYNIAEQGSKYKDEVSPKELEELMRDSIRVRPAQVITKKPKIQKETPEVKKPEKTEKEKKEIEPKKKKEEIKSKVEETPEEKPVKAGSSPQAVEAKSSEIQNFNKLTIKEIKSFAKDRNISLPSRARKSELIKKLQEELREAKEIKKEKSPVQKVAAQKPLIPKQELKSNFVPKTKSKPRQMPPKPKQTQLPIISTERILGALNKKEWQSIKHLIFKLRIKDMMDARFLQIKLKELERKGEVIVDLQKGKKYWKLA
ncbi:MAG: hypothetical protein GF383_14905 [Candidatus Lokiarchaeota archaeon]|nr:hypothetical protein [Candidatus Lokiarchaeota archaeon]MBD3342705.1 hypothetical protein [Candidatus Lokiarchaeota archaeon]